LTTQHCGDGGLLLHFLKEKLTKKALPLIAGHMRNHAVVILIGPLFSYLNRKAISHGLRVKRRFISEPPFSIHNECVRESQSNILTVYSAFFAADWEVKSENCAFSLFAGGAVMSPP
jgi:hypothetical protein